MSESELHEITKCEPLDTLEEVMLFLDNPPRWRSLCAPLHQHSDMKVINMGVNAVCAISVEEPRTFCHTSLSLMPDITSVIGVRQEKKRLPKTLVCHDMANGYHDDSIIQGTKNYDAYTFYNWGGIDIFCYFSHHFVTIPPLGWINVAHAHGVKVIGTVITEWSPGFKIWEELLQNDEQWMQFANILVGIAKILKFEGWLLNIENKINQPKKLLIFVNYLHKELHKQIRNAELIWYDSVTIEGELHWQNGLNEFNKDFFDATDGIFTNYTWSVENIVSSIRVAGRRSRDLYVGIDVWGRNFFGGGKFNTQQAIDVTYQFDCSVAIFAPAWTYETLDDVHAVENTFLKDLGLNTHDMFYLRDKALWDSLWPYLYTNLPNKLPFQTSFCRGYGLKFWHYGEHLSEEPWYKLNRMEYQPNANHGAHGYMLTTLENLGRLTQSGIDTKTKGGIVRYRNSFLVHELNKDLQEDPEVDKRRQREANKSVGTVIPPPVESALKRKFKSFISAVFGTKKQTATNTLANATASSVQAKRVGIDAPSTSRGTRRTVRSAPGASSPNTGSITSLQTSVGFAKTQGRFELSKKSLRKLTRMDSLHIMLKGAFVKTQYALDIVPHEIPCIEQYLEDGFNGGSCLKINPSDNAWPKHRIIRLFYCHFRCIQPIIICIVTKNCENYEQQYLNVHLQMTKSDGRRAEVRLIGKDTHRITDRPERVFQNVEIYNVYSLPTTSKFFKSLQNYLLQTDPAFYIPVSNIYGWKVKYYEFLMPWSRIKAIDVVTSRTKGPILLGYLGITERNTEKTANTPTSKKVFSFLHFRKSACDPKVRIVSEPKLIQGTEPKPEPESASSDEDVS